MSDFFQQPPRLENTYSQHRWMKAYLNWKLPKAMHATVDKDLQQLGGKCAGEYWDFGRRAEREKPVHVPYAPWGQRSDEIRVSTAWQELQNISAREGMIHIGYKREFGEFSRVYQFAKLYLFHPSSAFFTCPLAMADGAAKVLEIYGKDKVHKDAFAHLTSNQPQEFWTSGQWMTEKTGGSDVSGTSTEVRMEGGQAKLFGTKWFSSATTSQMALALARHEGSPAGSKGLSLFLVPMYVAPGQLNGIKVLRLKDKLGTWALPTAELELQGAVAYHVGEKDQGVKTVAQMLNVTRLYNSICSVGQATRALDLLRDYSNKRQVFGAALNEQPLHYTTFAQEELKVLAGFLLTMELVHLLGKEECKTATEEDSALLRLMTPVCKLFTARSAIETASEVVEGFGGVGYIEDSGIPVQLRDSQVFPIWEGATNVLSLDLLRVIQKSDALQILGKNLMARMNAMKSSALKDLGAKLGHQVDELEKQLKAWSTLPPDVSVASARPLAFHLAWLYAYALLLRWVDQEGDAVQKKMLPWVSMMSQRLKSWTPLSAKECESAKNIWLS